MKILWMLILCSSVAFSQFNAGLKGIQSLSVDVGSKDPRGIVSLNTDETAKMMSLLLKVAGITVSDESDYSLIIQLNIASVDEICPNGYVFSVEFDLFQFSDDNLISKYASGFLGFALFDDRMAVLSQLDKQMKLFVHHWEIDNGLKGPGF